MLRSIRLCLIATLLLLAFNGLAIGQDHIPWITELSQARQLAQQQQRLVLLHFWSEECPPCRLLEQNVFNQPELIRVMSTSFIPVKINALQQSKIADFYRIDRVPTDILVLPNGKEIYRTTSPSNANAYIAMLDQVRAKAMMEPSRSTDAMANNPNPRSETSLPPMASGDGNEEATSSAINTDPRAGLPDATRSERQRSSWKPDTAPNASVPQPVVVQNQYANAPGNNVPAQEASGGPRYDNPYVNRDPNTNAATAPAVDPSVSNPTTQPSGPTADSSRGGSFVPSRSNNVDAATSDISSSPMPSKNPWQGAGQGAEPSAAPSTGPAAASPPGGAPTDPRAAVSPPTEVPPIALDGFCPVTLLTTWKWTTGDPRWGVVHRGRTYLMASQADRDRFMSAPDRYSPALSGFDPVRFAESRQLVNGKREHGLSCNQTMFLFVDEESLKKFQQQPDRYVAAVRQAMTAGRPSTPQR